MAPEVKHAHEFGHTRYCILGFAHGRLNLGMIESPDGSTAITVPAKPSHSEDAQGN